MAKVESKRFNLSVPLNDTDVLRFLECQNNISDSIRHIIRQQIQRDGFVDVICKPIAEPGKYPGRPRAQASVEPVIEQIAEKEERPVPVPVVPSTTTIAEKEEVPVPVAKQDADLKGALPPTLASLM